MKIKATGQVTDEEVHMDGASGVKVRWLVGEADGAPNFAMRQFELAPGGHTPRHHHPYEHEIFVLAGEGVVLDGDEERTLRAGDCVYVAPDDVHQFRNTGQEPMKFLCMVPHIEGLQAATSRPECGG